MENCIIRNASAVSSAARAWTVCPSLWTPPIRITALRTFTSKLNVCHSQTLPNPILPMIYYRKFAPRCCVCRLPIMPEPGEDETVRVVALDRSFHVACYKCEDCGLLLSTEAEGRGCYPLDDHILCKNCNAKRVQALTSKMSTEL